MSFRIRVLAGNVNQKAGSHVYHYELIRRLAARGHTISVFCFQATPEIHTLADVVEIPRPTFTKTRLLWRFTPLIDFVNINHRLKRSGRNVADVAICGEHLFLKRHKRLYPETPLIYFPHAPFVSQEIQYYNLPTSMRWVTEGLYRYLQRWGLNHAEYTVRFTRQACELIQTHYGGSVNPRFFVNPIGIDVPNCPKEVQWQKREVRLLSVGRLVAWKGIDIALHALYNLREQCWRFDIVGEGEQRLHLERLTGELGLQDRVFFHGFQQSLDKWYCQSDLFLFPSKCEGLGLVALEAMSYGVPCLAISANGKDYINVNNEIIISGWDGLLAANEADFQGKLREALQNPEHLTALGEAARKKVISSFTWDRHIERYEALFTELVAKRKSTGPYVSVGEL